MLVRTNPSGAKARIYLFATYGTTKGVPFPFLHHGVVAAVNKWVAAQQSGQCHQPPAQDAEAVNRLHGVFRAGGNVAAGRREQRREGPLVSSQELKHEKFSKTTHFLASGPRLPASRILPRWIGCTAGDPLLYHYEGAPDFVQHCFEVRFKQ